MTATPHDDRAPSLSIRHNAIAMNIGRDMAILHGLVKPTPEEVAQYDAESRKSWERSRAEWEQADAFRAALAEVDDTVARIVLDLHRLLDDDTAECYGCPTSDEDRESWPCVTVNAVARAVGIEPPEGWLGHRPGPEPSTMPPDGYKPYALHRLSSFVDDAMAHALDTATFHGTTTP